MAALGAATVVIVGVLAFTKVGHVIDAATQRFMLYYAGVFALIGLTGTVLLGLLATDRVVMRPGHRVMAQAVHRAFGFGTLAFLVVHILTEILAQRSHALDGVIPFLSPYRTFYIGLGTIASDLIVALVVTSIIRKRFTAHGKAWRWRAIHYTSYVAFVFGVLHGLLGGRAAKPYVDWSYGFAIAIAALGVAVRFLATSLRPKETLSAPPGAERSASAASSPLRAAAMSMAQAQLGGTIQMLPAAAAAARSSWSATALPATQGWSAATGAGWSAATGPIAAIAPPRPAAPDPISGPLPAVGASVSPAAYRELGFTPLGAPPYGDDVPAGSRRPGPGRQPKYEPGYDGPPRFEGAPRRDVSQDERSYPYGSPGTRPGLGPGPASGPAPVSPSAPRTGTGPMPRADTGPMPQAGTGAMPRAATGPMPRATTGPMPRAATGPMPRAGTGPMPRPGPATGPIPRAETGPMPRVDTGPIPRAETGPMPRVETGPIPRAETGPMPRAETGPMPRIGDGPPPGRAGTAPRAGTGPMPRAATGPMPRAGTGAMPRAETGPMPRTGSGPMPRTGTGPGPAAGGTGSMPRAGTGPMPRAETGPMPRVEGGSRTGTGPVPRAGTGATPETGPKPPASAPQGPRTGRGRRGTGRPAREAGSTARRYREGPGPSRGDE